MEKVDIRSLDLSVLGEIKEIVAADVRENQIEAITPLNDDAVIELKKDINLSTTVLERGKDDFASLLLKTDLKSEIKQRDDSNAEWKRLQLEAINKKPSKLSIILKILGLKK